MLIAGEDIKFIARRLVILASEDIGNADPMALILANSAAQAVMFIGLPEAQLTLSQTVAYLAAAPKSNAATVAIGRVMAELQTNGAKPVPLPLRDSHYPGGKAMGHGKDYQYPHNFPNHYVPQQYLPKARAERLTMNRPNRDRKRKSSAGWRNGTPNRNLPEK